MATEFSYKYFSLWVYILDWCWNIVIKLVYILLDNCNQFVVFFAFQLFLLIFFWISWRCWSFILLLILVFTSILRAWFIKFLFEAESSVKLIFASTWNLLLISIKSTWESSRSAFGRQSDSLFFALFSDCRKWSVRILHWFERLVVMRWASS